MRASRSRGRTGEGWRVGNGRRKFGVNDGWEMFAVSRWSRRSFTAGLQKYEEVGCKTREFALCEPVSRRYSSSLLPFLRLLELFICSSSFRLV
ncbi:hypothetical protein F2P81_015875 [Scophthalmus maximus]|uniref:Uncharacterized protein n=1 Tax=Scophthalmus maximus TaxID=52904 RepID=A0A6A4SHG8_SCOMX|nr:hypothetical protein F2P81_015875 [Scophthalmus maximus]